MHSASGLPSHFHRWAQVASRTCLLALSPSRESAPLAHWYFLLQVLKQGHRDSNRTEMLAIYATTRSHGTLCGEVKFGRFFQKLPNHQIKTPAKFFCCTVFSLNEFQPHELLILAMISDPSNPITHLFSPVAISP